MLLVSLWRARLAGAAIVVTSALMGFVARPNLVWWTGEPSYSFYRQGPIGLVAVGQVLLWATPAARVALAEGRTQSRSNESHTPPRQM